MTKQANRSLSIFVSVLALLLPVLSQAADNPRDQILVSGDWLTEHAGDQNLVLLHIGPEEDFEAGHIPGAQHVDFHKFAAPHDHGSDDLVLELPEPADLKEALESLGVSDHSKIVVYWSSRWVTPATRTIFTLDWAGLGGNTVLLDGGIEAWTAAGNTVATEHSKPARGSVTINPKDLVVDAKWVDSHRKDTHYALVDARAPAYFDGVNPDQDKKGHIPGAGSLPWVTLLDESVKLKPENELRELLSQAGIEPGDTVVAYCHIGQFATMAMFAARTLGHKVLLYDGAWQDWARHDLPVETAP
jgi:thiosulfate/3-mercaptopyruvate sulfurtransferase